MEVRKTRKEVEESSVNDRWIDECMLLAQLEHLVACCPVSRMHYTLDGCRHVLVDRQLHVIKWRHRPGDLRFISDLCRVPGHIDQR